MPQHLPEAQYTPSEEIDSDIVKVNLEKPGFIEEGNIGFNIEALERICAFAGINELHIRTDKKAREYPQIRYIYP